MQWALLASVLGLAAVAAVMTPNTAAAGAEALASVTSDELGAVHVSAANGRAVYLNQIDVLGVLQQQTQLISQQQGLIQGLEARDSQQAAQISALHEQVCSSNRPSLTTIQVADDNSNKWRGGVLAPNGLIYGVPALAISVLIINPISGTADTTTISGLARNVNKWSSGVLAPNNIIYCFCCYKHCKRQNNYHATFTGTLTT